MFNLYQAPDQAAYRQAQLLDEVAADRMARAANGEDQPSTDVTASRAPRVIAWVTGAVSAIAGALHIAGRHPRGI